MCLLGRQPGLPAACSGGALSAGGGQPGSCWEAPPGGSGRMPAGGAVNGWGAVGTGWETCLWFLCRLGFHGGLEWPWDFPGHLGHTRVHAAPRTLLSLQLTTSVRTAAVFTVLLPWARVGAGHAPSPVLWWEARLCVFVSGWAWATSCLGRGLEGTPLEVCTTEGRPR